MNVLQAACIVGAITFTGMIYQVGGNTLGATGLHATSEAAGSAEKAGAPPLSAVQEASDRPRTVLGAELGSVPTAGCGPSSMAQAEIGHDYIETNSVDFYHHDVAGPAPIVSASRPAPVTQDFLYLNLPRNRRTSS
jgi:hypothetical protein